MKPCPLAGFRKNQQHGLRPHDLAGKTETTQTSAANRGRYKNHPQELSGKILSITEQPPRDTRVRTVRQGDGGEKSQTRLFPRGQRMESGSSSCSHTNFNIFLRRLTQDGGL